MSTTLQITWRNMPGSPAVSRCIRDRLDKLAAHFDSLLGAHVVVSAPPRHHRHGQPFHVAIDLVLPGAELAVGREPAAARVTSPERAGRHPKVSRASRHADAYLAVHDAFDQAHRRLEDRARRQRPQRRRAKLVGVTDGLVETEDSA
jgi:ribosome-associated translation inhibitor RaiA